MPAPATVRRRRAAVVADPGADAAQVRAALVALTDDWLTALFAAAVTGGGRGAGAAPGADGPDGATAGVTGVALVAVGGHGRRELAPFSDLDLVLLHEPGAVEVPRAAGRGRRTAAPAVREIADHLWYPVWDARVGLDHSVRTVREVEDVVRDDLRAQLGLLDLRHIAGDAGLSARTRAVVLDRWTSSAPERIEQLAADARARWRTSGEGAFLLEPDLKDSRGGLRDTTLMRALALAQLVDLPPAVRAAHTRLLDVRTELERVTGRGDTVLRLQEHGPVAQRLGLPDADAVLREVNEAARDVSRHLDAALRRIMQRSTPPGGLGAGLRRLLGRSSSSPVHERTPLARDVVAQGGEVVLARDADPWADPVLVLRAARAAAEHDLPLAPFTLERLASESAPMPVPWPAAAREELLTLLGQGDGAIGVLESLDAAGLLEPLLPEWAAVRARAQHNPVHRFTVDRHLLETAAQAAGLRREVDRPDLLLLGALLHDIGKGHPPRDHSVVGAEITRPLVERLGFPADDVDVLVTLVRHHLLLPDTATRRDLDDPVTVATVAEAVGSRTVLQLLHTLAIADAAATGPGAWSAWKAGLIADLVRRVSRQLQGAALPEPAELPARLRELAAAGTTALEMTGDPAGDGAEISVVVPDRPGVLSLTAGVLALHSLDVRSAAIRTEGATAVNRFAVAARFGADPDVGVLRADLDRALAGALPLRDRLTAKERTYAPGADPEPSPAHRAPVLVWLDGAASRATVLEVRTDDAIGLLYRLTGALEAAGLDIRSAKVSSLGRAVVDVFYLTTPAGDPVPAAVRPAVDDALRAATAASV